MRQGRIEDWRRGPISVVCQLDAEPEELERLLGISFQRQEAEREAILTMEAGYHVALIYSDHNTVRGVTLIHDSDLDVRHVLEDFLAEGGLDRALVWWVPGEDPPREWLD